MRVSPPVRWLDPGEIAVLGRSRARVVVANEAHDGLRRCRATRVAGLRMIEALHGCGVRDLALEALYPHAVATDANARRRLREVDAGYLAQPDMRALIEGALAQGWTLHAYEADMTREPDGLDDLAATNWREQQQAGNLVDVLERMPADSGLFVWCGNHHLALTASDDGWIPMGSLLRARLGGDVFAIDQLPNVMLGGGVPAGRPWARAYVSEIAARGGAAGFLADDAPPNWPLGGLADAYVLVGDGFLV